MSEHKTLGRREAFVDVAINSRITSMTMNLTYWTPRMLSVLRIVTGLLFLEHGTEKLLGFPVSPNSGPVLFSLLGIQGILELAGGFVILIGFLTRPVAFLLAGDMAVAYFMAHAPKGFFPTLNGGQLAILFCFVFLYLVFAGAGPWSVDEQLARSRLLGTRVRIRERRRTETLHRVSSRAYWEVGGGS